MKNIYFCVVQYICYVWRHCLGTKTMLICTKAGVIQKEYVLCIYENVVNLNMHIFSLIFHRRTLTFSWRPHTERDCLRSIRQLRTGWWVVVDLLDTICDTLTVFGLREFCLNENSGWQLSPMINLSDFLSQSGDLSKFYSLCNNASFHYIKITDKHKSKFILINHFVCKLATDMAVFDKIYLETEEYLIETVGHRILKLFVQWLALFH